MIFRRQLHRGRYQMVEDFVPQNAHHVEGLFGIDRVDQHVAMDADEVFRVQYTVLVLQE